MRFLGEVCSSRQSDACFAVIQDDDRVIQELDDYLGARGGIWSIDGLLPNPRLDPIRDDPRFLALVKKYKRR